MSALTLRGRLGQVAAVPVALALGAVAGYAVHEQQRPVYEARSAVLVLPVLNPTVDGGDGGRDVQIETEAQLLRSAQVALDAAEDHGAGVTPETLLADSTVTVPQNSQVLTVTFRHASPEVARSGSIALAEAYLARRDTTAAAERSAVVRSLEDQLTVLAQRLEDTTEALTTTPDTELAQIELHESQRDLILQEMADINGRLVSLRVEPPPSGELVSRAREPRRPVAPVLALNVGAGAILGGIAGGLLLLALRRRHPHAQGRAHLPVASLAGTENLDITVVDVGRLTDGVLPERHARALAAAIGLDGLDDGAIVVTDDPSVPVSVAVEFTCALAHSLSARPTTGLAVIPSTGWNTVPGLKQPQPGLRDVVAGRTALRHAVREGGAWAPVLGPGLDERDNRQLTTRTLTALWALAAEHFDVVVAYARSEDRLADPILQSAGRIVLLLDHSGDLVERATSILGRLDAINMSGRLSCVAIVTSPATDDDDDEQRGSAPLPAAADEGRDLVELADERR